MQEYAYIRVSSKEQNIARQVEAMKALGLTEKQMYIDKQSGKDFARPQYKKLLRKLKPNDVLYTKSIDRLGRNYEEVMEQWRYLTQNRKIDIVILDFPLLDTRQQNFGLTGKFLADLTLQVLSYVAQMERDNIKQRQQEGIRIAKENGVHFGRKPMQRPEKYNELKEKWGKKEISARAAAKQLGITHRTFLNWVKSENG